MINQSLTTMLDAAKLLIYNQQGLLEFTVVLASIFSHVLEARQNIWSKVLAFPIAFSNIYIYYVRHLYGKVTYSIIFIFFNVYAYIRWKGAIYGKPVQVSRTSHKMLATITGISILGSIIWGLMVSKYFNTTLSMPSCAIYGDACYLSFGFMDKWLMSHKKLERWVIALLRYIFFAFACYKTGALMLSMHYLILSCIGVYGQIKWYLCYKDLKAP